MPFYHTDKIYTDVLKFKTFVIVIVQFPSFEYDYGSYLFLTMNKTVTLIKVFMTQ